MSAQRAASLKLCFEQPGGLALRRPIGDQVKKNISVYAPRCREQGVLTADGQFYLEWPLADSPATAGGFLMGMRHAGSQLPADDQKDDDEAGQMHFASDEDEGEGEKAGDQHAQEHDGGPVEIEDDQDDDDDEDPSVESTELPEWPDQMELGVEHTFLCENEGSKLKFLAEAFPSAGHIFTDMQELHKGRARDYKDGCSYKTVPKVDGVISGFPCISVSPLNMYDLEFRDTTQATGCGWDSVKKFVRKFRPQWAILENVKSLAHSRKADNYKKPVDHICQVMQKIGYIPAYDVVNTLNFGLPQSRARCWMMFIRADCQVDQADLLGSFRSFMLQPCGLGKVLVGGHEHVGQCGGVADVDRMIAVIKEKHLAACIPERELCILSVACVDLVKNHNIDPEVEAVVSSEILCWQLVGELSGVFQSWVLQSGQRWTSAVGALNKRSGDQVQWGAEVAQWGAEQAQCGVGQVPGALNKRVGALDKRSDCLDGICFIFKSRPQCLVLCTPRFSVPVCVAAFMSVLRHWQPSDD
eukprot:s4234_g6.t1